MSFKENLTKEFLAYHTDFIEGEFSKGRPYWSPAVDVDKIKTLQENLAKDLVSLEDNELVTEQQLDKITDAYTQVYDIISKNIDKTKE